MLHSVSEQETAVTALQDLQTEIKAADATPAADRIVAQLCRGTTSKRLAYQVMFIGKHIALVKWRGENDQGYHVSGDVKILVKNEGTGPLDYEKLFIGFDVRKRHSIWDLDTRSGEPCSGRLVGEKLLILMEKVKDLDRNYVERRAIVLAEKRALSDARHAAKEHRRDVAHGRRVEASELLSRVRAVLWNADFTQEELDRVLVKEKA